MANKTGTVALMRKDRKGFQIDGEWYSSFNVISNVSAGDEVSFEFYQKNGFNNIRGGVKVDGASSGGGGAPRSSGGASKPAGGGYSRGKFPIEKDDGQRSIVRQNALTNARELFSVMNAYTPSPTGDMEEAVQQILSIAAYFEQYTTGEIDGAAIEANDMFPSELMDD